MSEPTQQLEVWCAGEEWCPITSTATLIGKKWHPVVVHRLLEHGPLGFNALQEEIGGISSNRARSSRMSSRIWRTSA